MGLFKKCITGEGGGGAPSKSGTNGVEGSSDVGGVGGEVNLTIGESDEEGGNNGRTGKEEIVFGKRLLEDELGRGDGKDGLKLLEKIDHREGNEVDFDQGCRKPESA